MTVSLNPVALGSWLVGKGFQGLSLGPITTADIFPLLLVSSSFILLKCIITNKLSLLQNSEIMQVLGWGKQCQNIQSSMKTPPTQFKFNSV